MEVSLYQSARGDMVIVPACLAPPREAIREFGMLYPRDRFETADDTAVIDVDALLERGFASVDTAQVALLRSAQPTPGLQPHG
ncbi:MAG: hypothetical protein EOP93_14605 [Lysobacteraceae bacterium]|nr:MAG: hypothetical protein EOP93_14605 [Xanthomonadaceae bacterium]